MGGLFIAVRARHFFLFVTIAALLGNNQSLDCIVVVVILIISNDIDCACLICLSTATVPVCAFLYPSNPPRNFCSKGSGSRTYGELLCRVNGQGASTKKASRGRSGGESHTPVFVLPPILPLPHHESVMKIPLVSFGCGRRLFWRHRDMILEAADLIPAVIRQGTRTCSWHACRQCSQHRTVSAGKVTFSVSECWRLQRRRFGWGSVARPRSDQNDQHHSCGESVADHTMGRTNSPSRCMSADRGIAIAAVHACVRLYRGYREIKAALASLASAAGKDGARLSVVTCTYFLSCDDGPMPIHAFADWKHERINLID